MECRSELVVRGEGGRYLFVQTSSGKLDLPSVKLSEGEGFQSAATRCLNEDLNLNGEIQAVLRVKHLVARRTVLVTFLVVVLPGRPLLHSPPIMLKWLGLNELSVVDESLIQLVASSQTYPMSILESIGEKKGSKRRESEPGVGLELKLQTAESLEEQVLKQAGYAKYELDQIAEEFEIQCGSRTALMTLDKFTTVLTQLGLPEEQCGACFRAFQTTGGADGLSLRELQLGLCCFDPATPHGSLCAQYRCQYIFQIYNKSGTKALSYEEFGALVKDIYAKRPQSGEKDMAKLTQESWEVFSVPQTDGIPLTLFLSVVGQLKFRGTSVLLRLPKSPVKRLTRIPSPEQQTPAQWKQPPKKGKTPPPALPTIKEPAAASSSTATAEEEAMETSVPPPAHLASQQPDGSLPMVAIYNASGDSIDGGVEEFCDDEYTIATHLVKVRRSGTLSDVSTLWDLVGTEAVSGSLDSILDTKPGFDRLPSINAFDRQSKSNEMLSGLRYFEHALKDNGRGEPKPAFSWGAVDMTSVARCFIQLCIKATDVFASETRLVEISSPTYVLGDLHGNFHDLVCFEKVLWRMGPVLTPAAFLFLGDYVDRGLHGFEVVAYLFAQKLLMPSKFLLIRGNHEIRAVQEQFSYKAECLEKFGSSLGMEVWEATNTAFDSMPIAALVDKKVFCVHGGIPAPYLDDDITSINNIPTQLPEPIDQSLLAWDIMWNDPIRSDEIDPAIDDHLKDNRGFIDNFARGTAHMFSSDALTSFLRKNKLSHVIRAHECKAAGFQIQQHGRLLTVFSSSHYCGATNEAACVLVDSKKIRTIRLDTT